MTTGRPDKLPPDYPDEWREVHYFLPIAASPARVRCDAQAHSRLGYDVTIHHHEADQECQPACETLPRGGEQ